MSEKPAIEENSGEKSLSMFDFAQLQNDRARIAMCIAGQQHPSTQQPFSAVETADRFDESELLLVLDLNEEKYKGKVVLTDVDETEVLLVEDSEEEVLVLAKDPSFIRKIEQTFGEDPPVVIHRL